MENYKQLCDFAEKKEYRIIVKKEFEYLVNSNLSDGAKLCWLTLKFEGLFTEGVFSVSNKELAAKLSKSTSAVSRYLSELELHEYIFCDRAKKRGEWSKNRVRVSFPDDGIESIGQAPDRKIAPHRANKIKKCGTRANSRLGGIANMGYPYPKNETSTYYNTISKNTNNNAVGASKKPEGLGVDIINEREICTLEQQKRELERKFLVVKNNEKYMLSRKIGEIEGRLEVERYKASLLKREKIKFEKVNNFGQALVQDAGYVNAIPGPLVLSAEQVRRISRELSSREDTEQLNTSINQLTYEVRFGNLSKNSYKTNKPIGTNHAINIGLKLARENRLQKLHIPELYERLCNGRKLESTPSLSREV